MPKNKATGQFESKVRLPQSSGLRLPPELRKQVECIADGADVTYSDALRTLVEEALRTRTGQPSDIQDAIMALMDRVDVLTAATDAVLNRQDLVYGKEGEVSRGLLAEYIRNLGDSIRKAHNVVAQTAEETRHWRGAWEKEIALTQALSLAMEETLRRSPGIQASIERRLAAIEERVGAQVYPAALLQKLDEIQSMCEGNHDQLALLPHLLDLCEVTAAKV